MVVVVAAGSAVVLMLLMLLLKPPPLPLLQVLRACYATFATTANDGDDGDAVIGEWCRSATAVLPIKKMLVQVSVMTTRMRTTIAVMIVLMMDVTMLMQTSSI